MCIVDAFVSVKSVNNVCYITEQLSEKKIFFLVNEMVTNLVDMFHL